MVQREDAREVGCLCDERGPDWNCQSKLALRDKGWEVPLVESVTLSFEVAAVIACLGDGGR